MTIKEQVAEKMRLEEKLKPKMRKFFKQMNADAKVIWKATGQLPDFSFYEIDLTAILREHYRLVSKKFSKTTRTGLKKCYTEDWQIKAEVEDLEIETTEEEESRIAEVILATLLLYIATHSLEQARQILITTNSDYSKIVDKIISDAAVQGINLERDEVADKMTEEFADKIKNKADVIALTETQNIAERSKLIEATILFGSALIVGGEFISRIIFKLWNTLIDGKERAHHRAANGQVAALDQPFIVHGEQLMHPSDTSLGASAGNIVNCRCTASFFTQ